MMVKSLMPSIMVVLEPKLTKILFSLRCTGRDSRIVSGTGLRDPERASQDGQRVELEVFERGARYLNCRTEEPHILTFEFGRRIVSSSW